MAYIQSMTDAQNPSDKAQRDILDAALRHVPFDGWTSKALRAAVRDAGLPEGAEELYFPGGALDVVRFWAQISDEAAAAHLATLDLENMKIRDKVTEGVKARLRAIGPHEEAARRAVSRLSLPTAAGQGAAQLWASADTIWRAIGDTSTDVNYYSKRTILSGVIGTSTMSWLSDETPEKGKALAFLDARIANVMQFEKAKWAAKKRMNAMPNPAEVLGRLRFGNRRRRRRAR